MNYSQIRKQKFTNFFQSVILILAMAVVAGLMGWLLFGWIGFYLALVLAFFLSWLSPRISPALVLKMYHAKPITRRDAPELLELMGELARRAELKEPPKLFYVPSRMLNAFAMGYDSHSFVAVTDGLLRFLRPREIAGVLAHEVSHIRFHDIKVLSAADMFSRFTSLTSRIGVFIGMGAFFWYLVSGNLSWWMIKGPVLFLAPIFSALLQLALSRSREFNADLGAVELTSDPAGLISALSRIYRTSTPGFHRLTFPGRRRIEPAILRTHPPLEERVERLLELSPKIIEDSELDPIPVIQSKHMAPRVVEPIRKIPRWHVRNGIWY